MLQLLQRIRHEKAYLTINNDRINTVVSWSRVFDSYYSGFTDPIAKNATVSVGGNHRLGPS